MPVGLSRTPGALRCAQKPRPYTRSDAIRTAQAVKFPGNRPKEAKFHPAMSSSTSFTRTHDCFASRLSGTSRHQSSASPLRHSALGISPALGRHVSCWHRSVSCWHIRHRVVPPFHPVPQSPQPECFAGSEKIPARRASGLRRTGGGSRIGEVL